MFSIFKTLAHSHGIGERSRHLSTFHKGQLFIYGGFNSKGNILSDLWVLKFGKEKFFQFIKVKDEMNWSQLDRYGQRLKPNIIQPSCINVFDNQICLTDDREGHLRFWNYSLSEDCWKETVSDLSDLHPTEKSLTFCYQGSLMILNRSNVFSFDKKIRSKEVPKKKVKYQENQLEDFLLQLFEEKEKHADVIFKVEDEEIPANKCILSIRCPHFQKAFSSKMMESHSHIIPINDVQAKVFKAMLQYIYFSDLHIGNDIAEDLFKLSHEYSLEGLKNECELVLMKNIEMENIIQYLQFAEKYEASRLKEKCLSFISKNFDQVFEIYNIKDLSGELIIDIYKSKPE